MSCLLDLDFEEDSEDFLEPGELDLDDDFEAELGSAAIVCPIPFILLLVSCYLGAQIT